MTIENIYYISAILGTIAVAITIIFLAKELRQNTTAIRSATTLNVTTAYQTWYLSLCNYPQSVSLWLKAMTNPKSCSKEEFMQFIFIIQPAMHGFQSNYYLIREGTLDMEIRNSMEKSLSGIIHQNGFRVYWEQRRDIFMDDFARYIDDLMAAQQPTGFSIAYQ